MDIILQVDSNLHVHWEKEKKRGIFVSFYLYSPLKMLDLLLVDGDSEEGWNIHLC